MKEEYKSQKQHGKTGVEIFSEVDGVGERIVHRKLYGTDAYDFWHLALYFKEVLLCKKLESSDSLNFHDIPRKEKCLLLYLLILSSPGCKKILELGSSLFELIDQLSLVSYYFEKKQQKIPAIDIKSMIYSGIEISDEFSHAAKVLHSEYNLSLFNNVFDYNEGCDIMYDRSVSNYVFENAYDVANFINNAKVSLLNIFLSKGETFVGSRLGKRLIYFSLEELQSYLKKPLYHLFGFKAPGPQSGPDTCQGRDVIEGFFISCEEKVAHRFMELAKTDSNVWNYFKEKNIKLTESHKLL